MIYAFIAERCSDLPVSVCCRVMKVSTSGYYQRRAVPVTGAELDDAHRANVVFDIWKMSRHSYGMPRIRREFHQGRHEGISRTTTARLMRVCGAVGIHYKRRGGCTRPGDGELSDWDDLRKEAARLHNKRTAAYLLGNPMLGDHLEEGLEIFGISSEGM